MSDHTEIQPALTAEEWAGDPMRRSPVLGRSYVYSRPGFVRLRVSNGDDWEIGASDNPAGLFATIALANNALPDNDPRKITGDDVTTLLDVAYYATEGGADRTLRDRLANIIDRIAALLPPE